MDKPEFQECAFCARKAGSPTLCPSCLNNRSIISSQQALIVQLRRDLFVRLVVLTLMLLGMSLLASAVIP